MFFPEKGRGKIEKKCNEFFNFVSKIAAVFIFYMKHILSNLIKGKKKIQKLAQ